MSNWIECYNPWTNRWHHVTRIPGLKDNNVQKGFSMVSIGDSVYIIGGKICHKVICHDEIGEVDLEVVLSSVLRYDLRNNIWSQSAPSRVPRFDFACTVCDEKIYVAGGQNMSSEGRGVSSAEVYDPALDEWRLLTNMSTLRDKCVGVTWQGKIHVVGDFAKTADLDEVPCSTMARCSAEVYDSENAKWDLMQGMRQLDVPPNQIVAVGCKLYSSGDCLNTWKGHIEFYNRKIWTEVDGSHLHMLSSPVSTSDANWPPSQCIYLTIGNDRTHLYFFAGYRLPGEISRLMSFVHVFDTSTNGGGWRSFKPLEEEGEKELCCHGCVVMLPHA